MVSKLHYGRVLHLNNPIMVFVGKLPELIAFRQPQAELIDPLLVQDNYASRRHPKLNTRSKSMRPLAAVRRLLRPQSRARGRNQLLAPASPATVYVDSKHRSVETL